MYVAEIWRYPVKSMAGERVQEARLGPYGVPGDRLLYVVDDRGEIVSARTRPALLAHRATLSEMGEVLVDGLPWDDRQVADAVRQAAGPGARLVRARGSERFDILPLLVVSDGALAVFGYDRRRLRPNIVLGGVEGLAERGWTWTLLAVGDAVVGLADLRRRCLMTTYDPDNLERDIRVLRYLQGRFGGSFALNAWTGREGEIAVGCDVRILEEPVALMVPSRGRFLTGGGTE